MNQGYHFIGIKGSGMSALATILHDLGYPIQGTDIPDQLFTQKGLEERQIPLYNFLEAPLSKEMTVVVGNAYKTHEEVAKAKEVGATCISYHECLGRLIQPFTSVAISGTHGKTTTTGLLKSVFSQAFSTTYLIGDGTGEAQADSTHFVFEACEYQRHFLSYQPKYTIITNIEHDHPDYFTDLDDVLDAFHSFANQTERHVIACGDDDAVLKLNKKTPLMLYGLKPRNLVQGKIVEQTPEGTTFDVFIKGEYFGSFKTPFFGEHMVLNSLAVITVAYLEGMSKEQMEAGLQAFRGVARRFNEQQVRDQILIDDYAHHPTEITVTLRAVRQKYPKRPVVAVFQPHTFSRTQAFLDEFASSLNLADRIYLTDIFGSAREEEGEISIQDLMGRCRNVQHLTLDNIRKLKTNTDAVLVFMGAGDIQKYEKAYLND